MKIGDSAVGYAVHYGTALCPPPVMFMDEWADSHRRLSEKASPEPGLWKTARVPFMREIMVCLSSESEVEEVSLMKGTQISGTEVLINLVLYVVDHDPTSMMIVLPTLGMAKRFSRQRLKSSIDIMPTVLEKIADERSRDSSNTILEKDFDGGYMILTGAESATGLRSAPIGVLALDETDAYPLDVEGEGDPEQLAIKRTQNYKGRRKIYKNSTPTTDGMSRIDKSFRRADQRHYHVPCPECGGEQRLQWKQIRWDKSLPRDQQPESAYYECEHCGHAIQEHHKTAMLAAGRWIADNPDAPKQRRSYHINSLYSPLGWYSWSDAVQDWLDAQGDVELLKTFTNTVLAETWKEQVNDVNAKMLEQKAEAYPRGVVPAGGLVLVAAVDTQDDRLEAYVYAVGRGEEQWFVDYEVFHGDPGILPAICLDGTAASDETSPWEELNDWLLKPWPHACGASLSLEGYAVDTQGHHTHDVYQYVRHHQRYGAMAIQGASQRNKPILGRATRQDIDWRGKLNKRGVQLYPVGTDTAKDMLYNRYQREEKAGPGVFHFPDWLPFEIFEQLTAEKKVRRYKKGHAYYEWVKASAARNEALDCTVYVQAVIQKVGIHRYSQARWEALEQSLSVQDLFSAPPSSGQPPPTTNNSGQKTNQFQEVKAQW